MNNFVNVEIRSMTGSNRIDAVLYPESGMLRYSKEDAVVWEHISSLSAKGSQVHEKVKELKEEKPKKKKVKA